MKIRPIITGASGMLGRGVLIECLEHPDVESVLVLGRRSCQVEHDKLKEIIVQDFLDYAQIEKEFGAYNACFFCLGVSSVGRPEADYDRITHDYTLALAGALYRQNPKATFCYISGAGTSPKSRMRWARIKAQTESELKQIGFANMFLFRPGYIQHRKGVQPSYRFYKVMAPVFPLLKRMFPKGVTTTEEVGLAMINAVLRPPPKNILTTRDIVELAGT